MTGMEQVKQQDLSTDGLRAAAQRDLDDLETFIRTIEHVLLLAKGDISRQDIPSPDEIRVLRERFFDVQSMARVATSICIQLRDTAELIASVEPLQRE